MEVKQQLSSLSGFSVTTNIGMYMEVPIIHQRVNRNTYCHLIRKVQDFLARWKTKCLSMAGHVTLAKPVLCVIPLYTMQSAEILLVTLIEIKKVQRTFIWGHDVTEDVFIPLHGKFAASQRRWEDWDSDNLDN